MAYENYNKYDFLKDEFFLKWVTNPTTESEKFWRTWLERHPEKSSEVFGAISIIKNLNKDVGTLDENESQEILEGILGEISEKSNRPYHLNTHKGARSIRFWYGIAASIAIAFVIFFSTQEQIVQVKEEVAVEYLIKENPEGVKSKIKLSDGSLVTLNSNSKIEFPKEFINNSREVKLFGEAFFEVAKNPDAPFIVYVDSMEIEALGTSFNIKSFNDKNTSVSLLTGKVGVSTKNQSLQKEKTHILFPGEQLTFTASSKKIKKGKFDKALVLGWKDNIIVFKDANFDEMTTYLSDWYGVQFKIIKRPRNVKNFTGRFKDQSLENVMKSISFSSGFEYKIENKTIKIY